MDDYTLTQHAKEVVEARNIKEEWIEKTLTSPSVQVTIAEFFIDRRK